MPTKVIKGEKVLRLQARIRTIRGASRLAMMLFCLSIGFVVVATAVPQRREVLRLEKKMAAALQQEQNVTAVKEHREIELRALREDPDYLETHARDRLDVCEEGETVFRFRKE